MFATRSPSFERNRRAVALVIVLAFVVLLTGLIIAFFSTAILDRQISNSSASAIKVDLFAQGAIDTLTSDFRQEIMAGSAAFPPSPQPSPQPPGTPASVYVPNAPPSAVVCLAGSTGIGGLENLLKRSARNVPFFANPPSASPVPYNPPGANPTYQPSARAASASSTTPSQNGRYVSPARWNKPLLLPKKTLASDSDATPVTTFAAPDWVLVGRDGSNPTAWNPNLETSLGNAASVIGRYAYMIYDEGGLLDMNAAGFPTDSSNQPDPRVAYKSGTPFADLAQLPGFSALSAARQRSVINAVVGWRNYASTQLPGGSLSTSFNFTGAPLTNFINTMRSSVGGFLHTTNATMVNGQTDRMFGSRQELLNLLVQGIPPSGSAGQSDRANLQNAALYLGTFSRGVNQPAYVPVPAAGASAPPDPSHRPGTQTIANGGNDASGGDNVINPSGTTYPSGFLSIRVGTGAGSPKAFTRADGTAAAVGDPLVKKRFDLNRLAWLTYVGPIAQSTTTYNPQLPADYVSALKNIYGFTDAFLLQGTAANIKKYFGLTWQQDSSRTTGIGDTAFKWFYNVHLWGTGGTGAKGTIMTLPQIAALTTATQQHDPDFFELIKASVCVGSLGKAYNFTATTANSGPDATMPSGYEQQRDNSVDAQVMQIAVNIIDQFDTDGYPTRVIFNDGQLFGGNPQEYRGVEDLPYLYRIREGKITVRDSNPPQGSLPQVPPYADHTQPPPPVQPTDPGLLAIVQEPEIWNPHGWSTASLGTDNTPANPRPTSFRVVALSTDPNSLSAAATSVTVGTQCLVYSGTKYGTATPATNVPGTPGPVWNEDTTEIDFGMSTGKLYLYREPTLLAKPGIPDSSVQIGAKNTIQSVFKASYISSQWPATQFQNNGVSDNQQYIGILAGSGPVAWSATIPQQGIDANNPPANPPGPSNNYPPYPVNGLVEATSAYLLTSVNGITYRLQYRDPNGVWATYDEKFADYIRASSYNDGDFWTNKNRTFNATSNNGTSADNIISTELAEVCFDPRTNRFGMNAIGPNGYRGPSSSQLPVRQTIMSVGWAATGSVLGAAGQLALATQRPDDDAGFAFGGGPVSFLYTGPTAPGWYPTSTVGETMQAGMFAQNNPAEASSPSNKAQVTTDPQKVGGALNQYVADADGVVRRAMGGYVPTDASNPATPRTDGGPSGLPMKVAHDYSGGTPVPNGEISSRPLMLNRPFRSPADLGVVFSGTPWRNLDVSTPESGAAALLDVFSVGDTDDPNGMVAGKVNLNTRQAPVLQAILAGAFQDELNPAGSTVAPPLVSTDAANIGKALCTHTSASGASIGPLSNLADLVGRWSGPRAVGTSYDGSQSYAGFSGAELATALAGNPNPATVATEQRVTRFREAGIRALASAGQTRVWNVMIDLVAQTGRYPLSASTLDNFQVEGEQRYWVHLAIDRMTGQVIDKQIEVVKE